jgi:hypothetical protein
MRYTGRLTVRLDDLVTERAEAPVAAVGEAT